MVSFPMMYLDTLPKIRLKSIVKILQYYVVQFWQYYVVHNEVYDVQYMIKEIEIYIYFILKLKMWVGIMNENHKKVQIRAFSSWN